MKLLFICISILIPYACRSRTTQSDTKHLMGQTSRDASQVKVCHWEESKSINVAADRYLAKLVKKIADSNPDTFRDNFVAENICVYLVEDWQLNAFAYPGLNKINVNTGLVSRASNDAEVASTLGHELAHLTMQSAHRDGDVPPLVLSHPDWPTMRDEFESENRRVEQKTDPLKKEARRLFKEQKVIEEAWSTTLSARLQKDLNALAGERVHLMGESVKISYEDYKRISSLRIPYLPSINDESPGNICTTCPATIPNRDANLVSVDPFIEHFRSVFDKFKAESPDQLAKWQDNSVQQDVIDSKIKDANQSLVPFQSRFDEFISNVAGPGAQYNWTEQEADEVGYELTLRAGIDPQYIYWIEKNALKAAEFDDCMTNHVAKMIPPNRENSSHPSNCWRIYDLLVLEFNYHKQDYTPLFEKAHSVTLFEGDLAAVKKAISK